MVCKDREEGHALFDRIPLRNAKDLSDLRPRSLLLIFVAGDRSPLCTEPLPTFAFWIEAA
jgi:hypothetical protein